MAPPTPVSYTHLDAVVVYNAFDNYRQRLANIPATNVLLSDLRRIAEGEPRNLRITGEVRDKMFARMEREEKEHGYVDYITISASLLFAMNREMRDAKYPFTRLKGKDVNTLIFPNLSSANSAYPPLWRPSRGGYL